MHVTKAMKSLLFLLFFSLSLEASSNEFQRSQDAALAHILTTSRILFKTEEFPIIQVIQTWEELSECGGSYESCPNARLFITWSMGDLYDAPLLYELPKSKGWEVISTEVTEQETLLIISTTLPSANISLNSRQEWSSTTYKIKLSGPYGDAIQIQ